MKKINKKVLKVVERVTRNEIKRAMVILRFVWGCSSTEKTGRT